MILIRNLRLLPDEPLSKLPELAARKLRLSPKRILSWKLVRRSLDARKKDDLHYVCSLALELSGDESALLRHRDVTSWNSPFYDIPPSSGKERPVIVGFGPAGMFAALVLSRAGLRPIILERGSDALSRREAIERFQSGGPLDSENNVQFGEGGAGTFSDGKLNTGTHDRRITWVLQQFYAHGAPEAVLYDAKPHIGTDILIQVVQSIRRDLLSCGCEIRFHSRLIGLELNKGQLVGCRFQDPDGEHMLSCRHLILAIGHSARDTFEMLCSAGIPMERKPFAMGVRIEHLQRAIDRAQYGRERGSLPPADYSLNVHLPDGRGVYTFCMCPGGQVFAAASECGCVVTNGMSYSSRSGENANSALLVGLRPEDFPGSSVLAGMYWQREIEQAAFRLCGNRYLAPAQLVGDFLTGRLSVGPGSVQPTYRPGVFWTDLRAFLPPVIRDSLCAALPLLGGNLSGFDAADAVLTGPETRSSSPVRILRGKDCSSPVSGLYPCGEGAGYAGGITSAAVDGMRCAEALISSLTVDVFPKT
ncbi:MAG: hypothetical protein K6C08_05710 [Oscillospiraceae bacterium]|nr:hypothetical protein [Oscillospiraceae bacterium]